MKSARASIAMYRPDHFRVEDVVRMHALMRARPFASLVSNGSTGLCASHLPTVLKDEDDCMSAALGFLRMNG
jgi:predicted FMN-binding regulatory protein PaiB